jgi:hypothetical protein
MKVIFLFVESILIYKFHQALAEWVRNNWRPISTVTEYKSTIRVTAIEIVWQTRRQEVEDEMKKILGVAELDSGSFAYFKQHVPAAKVVLDRMSEIERAELASLIEQRKNEGNLPDVQRRYVILMPMPMP